MEGKVVEVILDSLLEGRDGFPSFDTNFKSERGASPGMKDDDRERLSITRP